MRSGCSRLVRPQLVAAARAAAANTFILAATLCFAAGTVAGMEDGDSLGRSLRFVLGDLVLAAPKSGASTTSRAVLRAPEGWFGIGLRCSDCSLSYDDSTGARRWRFESAPEVRWVDPDSPAAKGGLEAGDVLVAIDGIELTTAEGGRRFGAVRPGDKVQCTLERVGKTRTVTLVAEEHPDREFSLQVESALREAKEELDRQGVVLRKQLRSVRPKRPLPDASHIERAERQLEEARRQIEAAQRQIERANDRLERSDWYKSVPGLIVPGLPVEPHLWLGHGTRQKHLRYEGTIGGSHVEVRGSGAVAITEESGSDELIVTTPDATIRISKKR